LEVERYGFERIADLAAFAWGVLGEARRLQLDLPGAGEALAHARAAFRKGTGDLLEEARLVSFEMSLADDEGEIESAVDALGWVARVYRRAGERHREGKALLLQAKAAGQLDPQHGLSLLTQALERADRGDSWIELYARHQRISCLNDIGRSRHAAMLLDGSRHLYRPFGDLRTRLDLRWLEGRIALSLGDLATAEAAFEEVLPVFSVQGLRFQLSRLAQDLTAVYEARGRREKVFALAAEPVQGRSVH
jgi:hypothetical protein